MSEENNFNSGDSVSKDQDSKMDTNEDKDKDKYKEKEKEGNNKKTLIILSILAICIALIFAGACFMLFKRVPKNDGKQAITQDAMNGEGKDDKMVDNVGKVFGLNLVKPVFAEFVEMKDSIKPSLPRIEIKTQEMENLNNFKEKENIDFSNEQKQALEEYGFFLADNDIIKGQESGTDDFVDLYDRFDGNSNKYYRQPQNTVFITSDTALHLYHILIDRSFQRIEEIKFRPLLRAMTKTLFLDSINQYNAVTDPALKESYKRLSAYYLIPLVVLDAGNRSAAVDIDLDDHETLAQYMDAVTRKEIKNSAEKLQFSLDNATYEDISIGEEIYELASQELKLINDAKGLAPSPLFTPLRPVLKNDYSQFVPRSHYTKNDILKSYFIAMMWYGRMGFTLDSPELTQDALVVTRQINELKVGDEDLSKLWSDMTAVIDFFVGEVDDLTAYQYTKIMKEIYGERVADGEISNDEFLNNFIQKALDELPPPKIISEALDVYDDIDRRKELLAELMQFRFMGQRFTIDAYIINNLTQGVGEPDAETEQKLPSMPTALMPISLLKPDNKVVKTALDEWIVVHAPDSDRVIAKFYDKLDNEFSSYGEDVWTQNIYWSWLYCFKSLMFAYGEGYPSFMTNENWQKKSLGTVLGSFTELKHDTLLYAKQSYAEMGSGGDELPELPPVVKGYVEPDLIFWNRIIALAKTTQNGLNSRDILPEEFNDKYQAFVTASEFFRQIAEQELQNQKISDEDFERLRTISSTFETIVAPIGGKDLSTKDRRAGIIADIHTDAVMGEILYEATGKPYIIYVAVSDVNGTRLTRGAVFNHYEFTNPIDGRLTDEDWQAKVYDNESDLPEEDKWSREIKK
ncbi:MAG: DUF3160 domain-containing protein [Patescibacteria group bacterium]|nr:DUF3160 domain-containing protein [Patescibacteria group bacterium]